MKCRALPILICLCLIAIALPALAEAPEPSPSPLSEDLLPVVILICGDAETAQPENILLIVVNSSTGKAMKATLKPFLFEFEGFDSSNPDSVTSALQVMEEELGLPLDQYVCLDLGALKAMEPGSAKDKGVPDLIQMGMSLLNAIQTNVPLVQAFSIVQMVYLKKDQGIEITLTESDDASGSDPAPDWERIRATLAQSISQLESA